VMGNLAIPLNLLLLLAFAGSVRDAVAGCRWRR
jgi:hypothetical protein